MTRSLFRLLLVLLLAGCGATTPSAAEEVFRDCSECPELVVVVPGADLPAGLISPIAVGRYEVTRDEFAAFEADERIPSPGCFFAFSIRSVEDLGSMTRQHPGLGDYQPSGKDPAICVSWIEAQAYVDWLSRKTGQKYRLPYAEEHQYFQGAGATTGYAWGDLTSNACAFANGLDATAASQEWAVNPREELREYLLTNNGVLDCDDGAAYTAHVGSYQPNAFGLYDTTGNVWEWTADCITDESRWPEGSYYPPCIARGGSWQSSPDDLSTRGNLEQLSSEHAPDVGLRVVRLISD
jgi:formylglycine-generating enzyme required for sulfatase activity